MASSSSSSLSVVPPDTFAVMVGKLHAERVKRYLLGANISESLFKDSSNEDALFGEQVTLLDSPALTGVSRARRGYVLLLLNGVQQSICSSMPAMGRQNISWIGRISHHYTSISKVDSDDYATLLWETLVQQGFDTSTGSKDLLRIDCHPREEIEATSRHLQHAAAAREKSPRLLSESEQNNPFECGPIEMTPSRSKCTHRLTVIKVESGIYWGVETRKHDHELMSVSLNNEASSECSVVPNDQKTGKEINDNIPLLTAPLSRAYYKLEEIWKDYLQPHAATLRLDEGVGLDIGASPGGWSQVMVHSMKMPEVVALDPAHLATRVHQLPQVTHLACKMEEANWKGYGPFSLTVCDASMLWWDLLDHLLQNLKRVNAEWQLPSTWILTMKLPFKTLESIKRQVNQIHEKAPVFVDDLARVLYPSKQVQCVLKVVHLMANADSERTLIITFLEKDTSGQTN